MWKISCRLVESKGGKSITSQSKNSQLFEEYIINAEFWKHHDTMRQNKMANFLTINSILAATVALLTSYIFSNSQIISISLIIGISIVGFFMGLTWNSVMQRNYEYMHFQRLQLQCIERKIPNCSMTFTKMYNVFDNDKVVHFSELQQTFKSETKSANKLEGVLPKIIVISWLVVAISCATMLIQKITA